MASTPNGLQGAFYECAETPEKGYAVHHAPTTANPYMPVREIERIRKTMRAETASKELDALFLDTAGSTIFPLANLLIDGEKHPDEFVCDYVGVTIDSNSGKGGPDRDGAAAVIYAVTCRLIDLQNSRVRSISKWGNSFPSAMHDRTDWRVLLNPSFSRTRPDLVLSRK